MFHHFHGGKHPKVQGSISCEDLEDILKFVGLGRLLNPTDWVEKVQNGSLREGDLCVTLDDGLLCQIDIALPVLEKLGIRAFWFIYSSVFEGQLKKLEIYRLFRCTFFSDIIEFYNLFFDKLLASEYARAVEQVENTDEIGQMLQAFPFYSIADIRFRLIRDRVLPVADYERLMDDMMRERGVALEELSKNLWMNNYHLRYLTDTGHVVGLHSYSHPTSIGKLLVKDQVDEYTQNYRHILTACKRKPVVAAYPSNSYNEDTLRILNDMGIYCGFRSNMVPPQKNGRLNPNHLELAREDHASIIRMIRG